MSSIHSTSKARLAAKRLLPHKAINGVAMAAGSSKRKQAPVKLKPRRFRLSAASARTFSAISDPKNAAVFTADAARAAFAHLVD